MTRQSETWSPVDVFSAGIAHEINNPLAIIAQETQWLNCLLEQGCFRDVKETRDCLESGREIARQVDRCKAIVGKLLRMARQMRPVIQTVDINCLVEEMVTLAERASLATHRINIVKDLQPGIITAKTDAPLVRQVLLNLLNNAIQAIDTAGTVTVRTATRDETVEISVHDDGCGIPTEHLKRIFTPFYSTKPEGTGTGLGLAISRSIVDLLGGRILVASDPGKGASFTIRLPVAGPPEG